MARGRARAARTRGRSRFRLCVRDVRARAFRLDRETSMSSDHAFHVHGPHDHEVEHAAHGGDAFSGRIAVMTAIFATIGAFFGYMAGATQNDALMYKNDSAIRRTEASDQWNFYQAKSSKQNLAELGAVLATGDQSARYKSEADRYNKEKQDIMTQAKKLEERSAQLEA